MKSLVSIFILIFSFFSCNNDDGNMIQNQNLIGTWKLIEVYESNGSANGQWISIENGYLYTFKKDGNFTSTRFSECLAGNYTVSTSVLTLDFGCENFDTGIETPAGTFVENLSYDDDKLVLAPTYLNCDEGCGYKFIKVGFE